MPASGGDPKRITYHPSEDQVLGLDTGWPENFILFQPG